MEGGDLVKADNNLLHGFRFSEVSDSGITAGAERLMLGRVEDLVDERFRTGRSWSSETLETG